MSSSSACSLPSIWIEMFCSLVSAARSAGSSVTCVSSLLLAPAFFKATWERPAQLRSRFTCRSSRISLNRPSSLGGRGEQGRRAETELSVGMDEPLKRESGTPCHRHRPDQTRPEGGKEE